MLALVIRYEKYTFPLCHFIFVCGLPSFTIVFHIFS